MIGRNGQTKPGEKEEKQSCARASKEIRLDLSLEVAPREQSCGGSGGGAKVARVPLEALGQLKPLGFEKFVVNRQLNRQLANSLLYVRCSSSGFVK